jgi:iron complex transport system ATP-binding protein
MEEYKKKLIFAKDLYLQKNGQKILNGLNFSLDFGQNLAIFGPNGSGKSFLASILALDLLPSFGSQLWVFGNKIGKTNLNLLRQKIGFVSSQELIWLNQNDLVINIVATGFFGTYGIVEDLNSKQINLAKDVLSRFGLGGLTLKNFNNLSDGQKRKVLICRALLNKPEILILDEPCQGLDIGARENFLNFLEDFTKEICLIYITHHLEELPNCITDVLFLKNGYPFLYGKKDKILTSKNLSNLFDLNLELIPKKTLDKIRYWLLSK